MRGSSALLLKRSQLLVQREQISHPRCIRLPDFFAAAQGISSINGCIQRMVGLEQARWHRRVVAWRLPPKPLHPERLLLLFQ